jgi:hypothetical protein
MKLRIKNTDFTLRIISWIQIVGGISGLLLICYLLLQTDIINGAVLLIFLIGLSLFIFSIYSGNALLSNFDKKKGIILTLINQTLQLFQWSMFGYGFSYSSGAELLIGIKGLSLDFNFGIIVSTYSMAIKTSNEFFIKINIISVLVIIVLIDIYRKIREKENTVLPG